VFKLYTLQNLHNPVKQPITQLTAAVNAQRPSTTVGGYNVLGADVPSLTSTVRHQALSGYAQTKQSSTFQRKLQHNQLRFCWLPGHDIRHKVTGPGCCCCVRRAGAHYVKKTLHCNTSQAVYHRFGNVCWHPRASETKARQLQLTQNKQVTYTHSNNCKSQSSPAAPTR
jgi:hypothetical protein